MTTVEQATADRARRSRSVAALLALRCRCRRLDYERLSQAARDSRDVLCRLKGTVHFVRREPVDASGENAASGAVPLPESSAQGSRRERMRLIVSVTRDRLGKLWQDDVMVECERHEPVDCGDRVTIWGRCAGTHSFVCSGGWTCTVPRILALRLRKR